MAFTKSQLKEAFCLATGWTAESGKTQGEWLIEKLAKIQERLDKIPPKPTALQRAKNIAIDYLLNLEREANADVEM